MEVGKGHPPVFKVFRRMVFGEDEFRVFEENRALLAAAT